MPREHTNTIFQPPSTRTFVLFMSIAIAVWCLACMHPTFSYPLSTLFPAASRVSLPSHASGVCPASVCHLARCNEGTVCVCVCVCVCVFVCVCAYVTVSVCLRGWMMFGCSVWYNRCAGSLLLHSCFPTACRHDLDDLTICAGHLPLLLLPVHRGFAVVHRGPTSRALKTVD